MAAILAPARKQVNAKGNQRRVFALFTGALAVSLAGLDP
jgi:hypothetical protein